MKELSFSKALKFLKKQGLPPVLNNAKLGALLFLYVSEDLRGDTGYDISYKDAKNFFFNIVSFEDSKGLYSDRDRELYKEMVLRYVRLYKRIRFLISNNRKYKGYRKFIKKADKYYKSVKDVSIKRSFELPKSIYNILLRWNIDFSSKESAIRGLKKRLKEIHPDTKTLDVDDAIVRNFIKDYKEAMKFFNGKGSFSKEKKIYIPDDQFFPKGLKWTDLLRI